MNNLFRLFSLLVALAGLLPLSGCTDDCKDVSCVQGGCIDGRCVCLDGYEGSTCNKAYNLRWTGGFDVSDSCSTTPASWYNAEITASATNPYAFEISPFYVGTSGIVLNGTIRAEHPDSADFTGSGNGLSFNGKGGRDPLTGEINIQFTVAGGSGFESCTAHLDKN